MDKEHYMITPSAFCVDDESIWFISKEVCALCCLNKKKSIVDNVYSLPNINSFAQSLFLGIHKVDNKVFIIPAWEKMILVFDVEREQFRTIELYSSGGPLFLNSFLIGDYIYAVPYKYRYLIRINVASESVEKIVDLEKQNAVSEGAYFNNSCLNNNAIVSVEPNSNSLFFYLLNDGEIRYLTVGADGDRFHYICPWSSHLALLDNNNKRVLICSERGDVLHSEPLPGDVGESIMYAVGDRLIIEELNGESVAEYMMADGEMSLKRNDAFLIKKRGARGIIYSTSESVFYYNPYKGVFECFDDGKLTKEYMPIANREARMEMYGILGANGWPVLHEGGFLNIETFLDCSDYWRE